MSRWYDLRWEATDVQKWARFYSMQQIHSIPTNLHLANFTFGRYLPASRFLYLWRLVCITINVLAHLRRIQSCQNHPVPTRNASSIICILEQIFAC